MDLQHVALQMFLHKDITIEDAYQQAERFLDYKIIYDAQNREAQQTRRLNENYERVRNTKITDCDLMPKDVFLSIADPFS